MQMAPEVSCWRRHVLVIFFFPVRQPHPQQKLSTYLLINYSQFQALVVTGHRCDSAQIFLYILDHIA